MRPDRMVIVIALLLCGTTIYAGEQPVSVAGKKLLPEALKAENLAPWEWSMKERLEHRRDPERRRQRVIAAYGTAALATTADVIDGHREPHLFLPEELMRSFLRRAFNRAPIMVDGLRLQYQPALIESGITNTDDFWVEMGVLAADWVRLATDSEAISKEINDATGERRADLLRQRREIDDRQTETLPSVLADAYDRFRIRAFNEFLYRAIPPGLGITFIRDDLQVREAPPEEGDCRVPAVNLDRDPAT